ncbi:four helix bundle protein [Dokdonella sp.]|uniref:four helix bundle protein n=1 Tax=Dokdonella sp. TaxID=2291710 RepID=UPI001B1AE964|nr:four helix bundle protein [Dokdonella sp.]MBO9663296.1 four helix bundle protein [Dokdonella sp.]
MHYRETIVWSKAMAAVRRIYGLLPRLPREEMFGIRSQLARAAVSVPCNIAEGWTRESRREKAQFLSIAHGSLAEAETLLTLCEQLGWFDVEPTFLLRAEIEETSRMLTALRRKTRNV